MGKMEKVNATIITIHMIQIVGACTDQERAWVKWAGESAIERVDKSPLYLTLSPFIRGERSSLLFLPLGLTITNESPKITTGSIHSQLSPHRPSNWALLHTNEGS